MCGIAGYAAAAGRPRPGRDVLTRMTDVLTHRGPDAGDVMLDGGFGLGHRRLSIIDVAGGDQPLHDGTDKVALVFNGEIYNHVELRRELEANGRRPLTASDGEVIVHGYLQWGLLGMLRRLRGMYAIALLDRGKQILHLARDPLGIKPLYYSETPDLLLFGSEMKAVLEGLPSRPAISSTGLFQSAALGFVLAPDTIFEGVHALRPGHCASWQDGRLIHASHHELVFEPGAEPADPDALWERLEASVSSHLMSEVPLGAFLSGGVDSSAVVTAMAGLCSEGVDAVSVGVLSEGMDERPFARSVAAELGVNLHEETAEPHLAELLPRLAWHLEGPFADTSAAPTWLVCEAARRHVTVALSGDGGDENFAGYRRTRYDVLEASLRQLVPDPVRRWVAGPVGRAWPRSAKIPRPLRAGTLLENLGGDWLDGYVRSLARIPEAVARTMLRDEVLPPEPLRAAFEGRAERVDDSDPLSRVMAMDFATWLSDDILVKVDRTSMAHSLEVRVPLLDTDFVEYAARLPTEAKLSAGEGKRLFRQSLRGRVPDAVLDRPKQGFHLPVGEWLNGPLSPILADVLGEDQGPVFDHLDPKVVRTFATEHAAGKTDRTTQLWFVLVLDAFLRHGPGAAS